MPTIDKLPYVVNKSAIGVEPTQKEIEWVKGGESLYGASPDSQPYFGSLNKTSFTLQSNIETCDKNINNIAVDLIELQDFVTNNVGDIDSSKNINPPIFNTNLPEYVEINEGEEPILIIEGENYDFKMWEYENNLITDINATPVNEGLYTLHLFNINGSTPSTEMFLHVIPSDVNLTPTITRPINKDINVNELEVVELKCIGKDYTNIKWRKNGVVIQNENTHILKFDVITFDDAGDYTCEFINGSNVVTSETCSIIVNRVSLFKPIIAVQPKYSNFIEDSTCAIYLNAQFADEIKWEKDGVELPNQKTGVIAFKSISIEDAGWYKAIAINSVGEVHSEIVYISVTPLSDLQSPVINVDLDEQIMQVNIGDSIDLTPIASYYNNVVWYKDMQAISNAPEIHIENATIEDAGQYKAIYFNKNGYVETNIATIVVA